MHATLAGLTHHVTLLLEFFACAHITCTWVRTSAVRLGESCGRVGGGKWENLNPRGRRDSESHQLLYRRGPASGWAPTPTGKRWRVPIGLKSGPGLEDMHAVGANHSVVATLPAAMSTAAGGAIELLANHIPSCLHQLSTLKHRYHISNPPWLRSQKQRNVLHTEKEGSIGG